MADYPEHPEEQIIAVLRNTFKYWFEKHGTFSLGPALEVLYPPNKVIQMSNLYTIGNNEFLVDLYVHKMHPTFKLSDILKGNKLLRSVVKSVQSPLRGYIAKHAFGLTFRDTFPDPRQADSYTMQFYWKESKQTNSVETPFQVFILSKILCDMLLDLPVIWTSGVTLESEFMLDAKSGLYIWLYAINDDMPVGIARYADPDIFYMTDDPLVYYHFAFIPKRKYNYSTGIKLNNIFQVLADSDTTLPVHFYELVPNNFISGFDSTDYGFVIPMFRSLLPLYL